MESLSDESCGTPSPGPAATGEPTPIQPLSAEQAGDAETAATVEAILFAGDSPLTAVKIAAVTDLAPTTVRKTIATLNKRYERIGSAFRIEAIAGGYQMLTLPEYRDVLCGLLRTRSESRLSEAAMETLAIVAYRQPILRADIEAIRGVSCGELLHGLLEKGLIKIVARAEVLGRPMLYGTTRRFLEVLGLGSLDDLPRVEELRSGAPEAVPIAPHAPSSPPSDATETVGETDHVEPEVQSGHDAASR